MRAEIGRGVAGWAELRLDEWNSDVGVGMGARLGMSEVVMKNGKGVGDGVLGGFGIEYYEDGDSVEVGLEVGIPLEGGVDQYFEMVSMTKETGEMVDRGGCVGQRTGRV